MRMGVQLCSHAENETLKFHFQKSKAKKIILFIFKKVSVISLTFFF